MFHNPRLGGQPLLPRRPRPPQPLQLQAPSNPNELKMSSKDKSMQFHDISFKSIEIQLKNNLNSIKALSKDPLNLIETH